MRALVWVSALGLVALNVSELFAQDTRVSYEPNTNREGSNYQIVSTVSAAACRTVCELNLTCRAFSFSPRTQQCSLKEAVPNPTTDDQYVSGVRGAVPDLTVVTINLMNSASLFEVDPTAEMDSWKQRVRAVYGADIASAAGGNIWTRIDRLARDIAGSISSPDIISITEAEGWRWCAGVGGNVGDYDAFDRLIGGLTIATGITYRVAYMVGNPGSLPSGRCAYFGGDVVLYNPNRLVNRNPDDATSFSGVELAHDSALQGMLFKRSLPICNPGTARMPLMQSLIDGGPQTDKCGRSLPSGPAWVFQFPVSPANQLTTPATVARFSFSEDLRFSFDVITVHPHSGDEGAITPGLISFVSGIQKPPYRKVSPYYPALLIGDFNTLHDSPTSVPGFTEVFGPTADRMAVRKADPGAFGFASTHDYAVLGTQVLPLDPTQPFSDHIAVVVKLGWVDPTARSPHSVPAMKPSHIDGVAARPGR
jgi:PAN domain